MNTNDEIKWLLWKIQEIEKLPNRLPTHRNIWAGSYDCWNGEQDRINQTAIPRARMKEAEEMGLIESLKMDRGMPVWSLTKAGVELLNKLEKIK
jgi:hypothetical protein